MSDPIADYLRENAAYIEDTLAQHPEKAEAFAAHIRALSTTPAETLPNDAEGHLAVVLAAVGPWTKYETSGQFARAILAEWNRQATALDRSTP